MSDYWMARTQDDRAPAWNFDLPALEQAIRRTFAATLVYPGMLEVARLSGAAHASQLESYVREMLGPLAE